MDKSNEQILRHLFNCKFSDDDWQLVLKYCHDNSIKGAHRALAPKSECTYEQFLDWVNNGLGVGDIAIYDEQICVVGDCLPSNSYIIAVLKKGKVVTDNVKIDPDKLKSLDKTLAKDFVNQFHALGYEINPKLAVVTQIRKPFRWTKIKLLTAEGFRYGVVSDCDNEKVVMAFLTDGEKVWCNVPFRLNELEWTDTNGKENALILDALRMNGYVWNQKSKSLDVACKKANKGDFYWYITDQFTIKNSVERGNNKDNARRQNGNYFLTVDEATAFLLEIVRLRTKWLSEK